MARDPAEDFLHPGLAAEDPLAPHVLYRLTRPTGGAISSSRVRALHQHSRTRRAERPLPRADRRQRRHTPLQHRPHRRGPCDRRGPRRARRATAPLGPGPAVGQGSEGIGQDDQRTHGDVHQHARLPGPDPKGSRRALQLADGYFEWLAPERRGSRASRPRQPFFFQVDGGAPFAFASLWTPAKVQGEWITASPC